MFERIKNYVFNQEHGVGIYKTCTDYIQISYLHIVGVMRLGERSQRDSRA